MYQTLIEKFADVLIPIACGLAVWLGVHYFILTPRIVKVEMPRAYDAMMVQLPALPRSVHHCLRTGYAGALMEVGRLEAALFTATLKHVSQPFRKKSLEALVSLDKPCGMTKALEAERERLRLLAERQKNRRRAELELLRRQAEFEARRRKWHIIGKIVTGIIKGE